MSDTGCCVRIAKGECVQSMGRVKKERKAWEW